LSIALNPGLVPASGVYSLAGPTPPFAPALTAAPNDWSLSLSFSGGGLSTGTAIAIDAEGNVWVAGDVNSSTTRSGANLSKFNNAGLPLSPPSGFDDTAASSPNGGGSSGIAIDGSGNVWVSNFYGTLSKFSSEGVLLSPPAGYTGGGLCMASGLAVDSSGNIWVSNASDGSAQNGNAFLPCTNIGTGRISEFDANGVALSPTGGYADGGPSGSNPMYYGIAVDSSGSVWIADGQNDLVRYFNSSGTALTAAGGYQGGGLNGPRSPVFDSIGNLWMADGGSISSSAYANAVSEFSNTGTPLSPLGGYAGGGLYGPRSTAVDGGNNVWVGNTFVSVVTELNDSGVPLSPSGFLGVNGNANASGGIAIDGAGNVWATGAGSGLTEFVGAAVPVKTPLVGPPQRP